MLRFLCVLRTLLLCGVLCTYVDAAEKKPKLMGRTLDRLAASMLHAYPELKNGKRTRVAREELVKEFEGFDAGKISSKEFRAIKRRKVDYSAFEWLEVVEKFDRARFENPKSKFLLKLAKEQKMGAKQHFAVKQLLRGYYEKQVEEREELLKKRLRLLGKGYSSYLRAQGKEPQSLKDFVQDEEALLSLDPLTGERKEWVYVGAGPVPVLGTHRYRLVAYSPFLTAKGHSWIVYKGGKVGTWKNKTLLKKHAKMKQDCADLLVRIEQEKIKKEQERRLAIEREQQAERARLEAKKVKITIRELW